MADYKFISETGTIVPDFADTLEQVKQEFWSIPGWEELDLSPETPQGALATAFALERDNILRNNALLANQINPDIATGIFLDGLMSLMGGQRHEATSSILNGVVMTGRPGTIIPAGSLATDGRYDWSLQGSRIIGSGGSVTGDFVCVETGPIDCEPHGLDTIAQSVLGWEGVDNPSAAIPGRDRETDLKLRRRRELTLAAQGIETVEAIVSALYSVKDVRSLSFWENYTDQTITKDNVTMVPHSIYVCIDGGTNEDIARALKRSRGVGAGYNGAVEVTITDEITGQDYVTKFDRPQEVPLMVKVRVKTSSVNASLVVPDLVMAWARGETATDAGLLVGRDVSPFEIAASINEQEPRLYVKLVEISSDSGSTWSTSTVQIMISQLATLQRSAVTVIEE